MDNKLVYSICRKGFKNKIKPDHDVITADQENAGQTVHYLRKRSGCGKEILRLDQNFNPSYFRIKNIMDHDIRLTSKDYAGKCIENKYNKESDYDIVFFYPLNHLPKL